MIFYNSIYDVKPMDLGQDIKYLFSNSFDFRIDYDKGFLSFKEFLAKPCQRIPKTKKEADLLHLFKPYLLSCIYVN